MVKIGKLNVLDTLTVDSLNGVVKSDTGVFSTFSIDALVPIGSIIPFYDFNGALTFNSSYWCYVDGTTQTIGGVSRVLPDLSNRYLVGFGTEAGGDIGTAAWATAAVGNANHTNTISSADLPTHTHDIAHGHANSFAVSSVTANYAVSTVALGGTTTFASSAHKHTMSSHIHGAGTLQMPLGNGHDGLKINITNFVGLTNFTSNRTIAYGNSDTDTQAGFALYGSTGLNNQLTDAADGTAGVSVSGGVLSGGVSGGVLSGSVTALGTTASGNGGFANTALNIQTRSIRIRWIMRRA